jgi:hypothetical protein
VLRAAAGAAVGGVVRRVAGADAPATTVPVGEKQPPIDRRALVGRHNVVRTKSRDGRPLQVGNGNFAFGADITGLQTFVAFNTMSQWGWYTAPLPAGQTLADLAWPAWDSHGKEVPYESGDPAHPQITQWSFSNPTRINLGRIGLTLLKTDGARAVESDLTDARQELNLWTGTLTSPSRRPQRSRNKCYTFVASYCFVTLSSRRTQSHRGADVRPKCDGQVIA